MANGANVADLEEQRARWDMESRELQNNLYMKRNSLPKQKAPIPVRLIKLLMIVQPRRNKRRPYQWRLIKLLMIAQPHNIIFLIGNYYLNNIATY
jgi:hypothetical protein